MNNNEEYRNEQMRCPCSHVEKIKTMIVLTICLLTSAFILFAGLAKIFYCSDCGTRPLLYVCRYELNQDVNDEETDVYMNRLYDLSNEERNVSNQAEL